MRTTYTTSAKKLGYPLALECHYCTGRVTRSTWSRHLRQRHGRAVGAYYKDFRLWHDNAFDERNHFDDEWMKRS